MAEGSSIKNEGPAEAGFPSIFGGVRFPHRLEERGVPGDVCEEKRSVADLRLTRLIVCQRRSSFHVDVQTRERSRPAS